MGSMDELQVGAGTPDYFAKDEDHPLVRALLALKCTSCGHTLHTSFTDTPGCPEKIGGGIPCQCARATMCGDDILQLIREVRQSQSTDNDCSDLTIASPEDLLQFHKYCATRGQKLMGLKNHDYAGYAAQRGELDVMKNFRAHEEYGIVVRMGDKLKRLENFALSGKLLVEDESIFDTAIDILNYAILYLAYGRERRTRLLREVRSKKVEVISQPAAVGPQYDAIVRMYHLVDNKKVNELRKQGHRDLADILDEIRSYQWQDAPKKVHVVHDLATNWYVKLDEDGCLPRRPLLDPTTSGKGGWYKDLAEDMVVIATGDFSVNFEIQFGVVTHEHPRSQG